MSTELSPFQIAELSRIVAGSKANHHDATEEDAEQLRTQLADWFDVPIWLGKQTVPVGEQLVVFLSEGEKDCSALRFKRPWREGSDFVIPKRADALPDWAYERTTLGDLVRTQTGIRSLCQRLDERCVAPYTAEEVADFDLAQTQMIWTWDNDEHYPTALYCIPQPDIPNGPAGEFPVLIPSAWGKLTTHWHGCLHLQAGYLLIVCDHRGQYGLVQLISPEPQRVVGQWLRSCNCAYLAGGEGGPSRMLELASAVIPDERGELVCDLFSIADGVVLNPPRVKGLMGTARYDGAVVVNELGFADYPRVLGRVNAQGVLFKGQHEFDGELEAVAWGVDDLKWLEIGSQREGLTAVRSAENGLWGFVDRSGALAIPTQYADVFGFDEDLAAVSPANSQYWGLIDRAGEWVMSPNWLNLERWEKDLVVVESAEHHWGAVDDSGNTLVDFKPWEAWLSTPEVAAQLAEYQQAQSKWPKDFDRRQRQEVVDAIRVIAKRQFREQARQRLLACGSSLGPMEGVFGARTSERDLREAGLWGRAVRLLANKTDGMLQPKIGEVGRIGCSYPVTLSIFDLSVEVPVSGLPNHPETAVGVPWCNLQLVEV